MLEYRRDAIVRAIQAKGYRHFGVRSFRAFGQLVWEVSLQDETGQVFRVLGGPAATYPKLMTQIAALPLMPT
jgi:hypothetical protein